MFMTRREAKKRSSSRRRAEAACVDTAEVDLTFFTHEGTGADRAVCRENDVDAIRRGG